MEGKDILFGVKVVAANGSYLIEGSTFERVPASEVVL